MSDLYIRPIIETDLDALAALLIETVAHGGSVSFMHPLMEENAKAFWQSALASMTRGERVVLGAFDGPVLTATVSVVLDAPPNQPHRAEIAKLMTVTSYRGRGIARQLMQAAESLAMAHRKTLLILDTAEDGGASGLYAKLGYTCAGTIPDYALKPHGGFSATVLFWKRLYTNAHVAA